MDPQLYPCILVMYHFLMQTLPAAYVPPYVPTYIRLQLRFLSMSYHSTPATATTATATTATNPTVYMCIYACMCIYVCMCMYVCMYVCMDICILYYSLCHYAYSSRQQDQQERRLTYSYSYAFICILYGCYRLFGDIKACKIFKISILVEYRVKTSPLQFQCKNKYWPQIRRNQKYRHGSGVINQCIYSVPL